MVPIPLTLKPPLTSRSVDGFVVAIPTNPLFLTINFVLKSEDVATSSNAPQVGIV